MGLGRIGERRANIGSPYDEPGELLGAEVPVELEARLRG